jgi:DNA-binding response OmpR family regulator
MSEETKHGQEEKFQLRQRHRDVLEVLSDDPDEPSTIAELLEQWWGNDGIEQQLISNHRDVPTWEPWDAEKYLKNTVIQLHRAGYLRRTADGYRITPEGMALLK